MLFSDGFFYPFGGYFTIFIKRKLLTLSSLSLEEPKICHLGRVQVFTTHLDLAVNPYLDKCLMLFSTLFQLYHGSLWTYPCFLEFFLLVLCTILIFPHKHHHNNGHIERAIDPVARTNIIPRKDYWQSHGVKPETSCYEVLYATRFRC